MTIIITQHVLFVLYKNLLISVTQFVKSIPRNDVSTYQSHGWIKLSGLLPQNRAGKHRMVPILTIQIDFNLQTIIFKYNLPEHAQLQAPTGNSSFPFQIPVTCLCIITCFILSSAGIAVHPALIHVVRGLFTQTPNN